MFRISCSETRPSMRVPVLKYSSRRLARSNTISAPTFSRAMASQAITVCKMTSLISFVRSLGLSTSFKLAPPTFSTARRSSG